MKLRDLEETINVRCVIVNIQNVGNALKDLRNSIKKIRRLPSVIDPRKEYSEFRIECNEFQENDRIILIGRENSDFNKESDISEIKNEYRKSLKDEYTVPVVKENADFEDGNNNGIILIDNGNKYIVTRLKIILTADYFSYQEILKKLIPPEICPGSFEIIGNIIHLNLDESHIKYKKIIGEIIHYKTGMTVINKIDKIHNDFRFYEYEILAGNNNMKTFHVEDNVKIFIDLEKVYWCSRLQNERLKIVKDAKKGEVVCDPFCGVGALVLLLLKKGLNVYANDLNPTAIDCLKISLKKNKLTCNNISVLDAATFIKSLYGKKIDKFVFNLPEHSLEYIKYLQPFSNFELICFFFFRGDPNKITLFVKSVTGISILPDKFRLVRKVSSSKGFYLLKIKDAELFAR